VSSLRCWVRKCSTSSCQIQVFLSLKRTTLPFCATCCMLHSSLRLSRHQNHDKMSRYLCFTLIISQTHLCFVLIFSLGYFFFMLVISHGYLYIILILFNGEGLSVWSTCNSFLLSNALLWMTFSEIKARLSFQSGIKS